MKKLNINHVWMHIMKLKNGGSHGIANKAKRRGGFIRAEIKIFKEVMKDIK